jgi:hypothetical protein
MFTHIFRPTTDEFAATIIRELTEQECDPEVGRMYEVLVHAYADELTALPAAPSVTVDGLLDTLQEILYPMSEPRDHQWDGGDVCEALAGVLNVYRPEARFRQRAEVPTQDQQSAFDAYVEARKAAGI